jgi:hypothetical protein
MTLDGTDLYSTYGLRLSTVENHLSQPKRKKLLKINHYGEYGEKFNYEAKAITVRLFAVCSTKNDVKSLADDIRTMITASSGHSVVITEHGISMLNVVIRNGVKIDVTGQYLVTVVFTFEEVTV